MDIVYLANTALLVSTKYISLGPGGKLIALALIAKKRLCQLACRAGRTKTNKVVLKILFPGIQLWGDRSIKVVLEDAACLWMA